MESYEFYKKVDPDKLILRDYLAFDRTVLANYRTALSFYRTALGSLAAGLALIQIYQGDVLLVSIGFIALGLSVMFLATGVFSFFTTKKRMKEIYNKRELHKNYE
ncbi:hypothetical protein CL684_00420 [Candidatus Campbellbacteria bacterium]|nr:hypothetical protein [Candidatus Campbellbacteria bacterium]|tara:strand:- start:501 stop:815 length:315 start_codon:yes stop_codon:yes gene_type:complete